MNQNLRTEISLAALVINKWIINKLVKTFESLCLNPRQAKEVNCYAVIDMASELSLKFWPFYQGQPYWNSE